MSFYKIIRELLIKKYSFSKIYRIILLVCLLLYTSNIKFNAYDSIFL